MRSEYLAGLAQCHITLGTLQRDPARLCCASQSFLEAVDNPHASAQTRLRYALEWCKAPLDPADLLVAHGRALALLPRAILFGTNMRERLDALKNTPGLSVDAAMHALACADAAALVFLEQGRAVFWAQALRSRKSCRGLPGGLADRILEVSRALEMEAAPDEEQSLCHRQGLMKELDALIDQARQAPGGERFLEPLSAQELLAAARRGPVVLLLADDKASWAIIVHDAITHIPLPGVTTNTLRELGAALRDGTGFSTARSSDRKLVKNPRPVPSRQAATFEAVLQKLWVAIVRPVIVHLQFKSAPASPFKPRIFWCPTGPFVFLPVHAAGSYVAGPVDCVADYVLSSYTPTISALLNARRDPPDAPFSTHDSLLLTAVPSAPGYIPLPYASHEVQRIHALMPSALALDGDVTVGQLAAELPSRRFLHLACHGTQDARAPLNSGFVFQDRTLTVSALMDLDVPGACFAFLSACESAMGDESLPDETVHLAAAMLFIGFRSVIGTMWSMHDVDGPLVAEYVYKELLKNGKTFDYDAVPRALDAAVRELRSQGVHPSRWATWIHMGI